MRMPKLLGLTLILVFFFSSSAFAQSKIIKKQVTKVIKPQVAPTPGPEEIENGKIDTTHALPPAPATLEDKVLGKDKGVFGWGLNADLGGLLILNQNSRQSTFGLRGNLVFSDPLKLGERIGLAEDAFEYKLGLGLVLGNDNNGNSIFSIPLCAEIALYLKEGSLFGLSPFIGGGLNFNLLGTDSKFGGSGSNYYGGILVDFGLPALAGKTALSLGYHSARVENIRSAEGLYFAVTQPLKL